MAKTGFKSVDAYIAAQPETSQAVLTRVRTAIRKALPAADEVISYQMPTYKQHGKAVPLLRRLEAALFALPGRRSAGCGVQEGTGALHDQQGHDPVAAGRTGAGHADRADREVSRQGAGLSHGLALTRLPAPA
jgi:hypothetical protein